MFQVTKLSALNGVLHEFGSVAVRLVMVKNSSIIKYEINLFSGGGLSSSSERYTSRGRGDDSSYRRYSRMVRF
jgi:hypothetical protein